MSKKRSQIKELRAENERLRDKLELKGMVYEGGGVWRRASDPNPKDEEPEYARCLPLGLARKVVTDDPPDWTDRLPKIAGAAQNILKEVEAVKESTRGTKYARYGLELATQIRYLVEVGHDGESLGDLIEDIRVIEELPESPETESSIVKAAAEMIFEAELKGGKKAEIRIHREGTGFIGMLCPEGRCWLALSSDYPPDSKTAAELAIMVFEETYGDKLKRIVLVENDEDDELDPNRDPSTEIRAADDMKNRVRKILNV